MIVSGAAPPRVDTLRRVRRGMSRPVFHRFCHARSRVPIVLGLSIIAPSVNVLSRTRRKPSTIGGAAPDVVIGQSTAAPAGARPYHRGGTRFARLAYVDVHGRLPDDVTIIYGNVRRNGLNKSSFE